MFPSDVQLNKIHLRTATLYDGDTEESNSPERQFARRHRLKKHCDRSSVKANYIKSDTSNNDEVPSLSGAASSSEAHSRFDNNQSLTSSSEDSTIDKQFQAIEILYSNGFNQDTIIQLQSWDVSLQHLIAYLHSCTLPNPPEKLDPFLSD